MKLILVRNGLLTLYFLIGSLSAGTIPVTGRVITQQRLWDHGNGVITPILYAAFHFEGSNLAVDGYNIYPALSIGENRVSVSPTSIRIVSNSRSYPDRPSSRQLLARVLLGSGVHGQVFNCFTISLDGLSGSKWSGILTIYTDSTMTKVVQVYTLLAITGIVQTQSNLDVSGNFNYFVQFGGPGLQSLGSTPPLFY
jgi:hypothetical protein